MQPDGPNITPYRSTFSLFYPGLFRVLPVGHVSPAVPAGPPAQRAKHAQPAALVASAQLPVHAGAQMRCRGPPLPKHTRKQRTLQKNRSIEFGSCSGYSDPFGRNKFEMANQYPGYEQTCQDSHTYLTSLHQGRDFTEKWAVFQTGFAYALS